MTRKEWYAEEIKKASPEATYEWIRWLMYCHAKQSIIEWLKQEKEGDRNE